MAHPVMASCSLAAAHPRPSVAPTTTSSQVSSSQLKKCDDLIENATLTCPISRSRSRAISSSEFARLKSHRVRESWKVRSGRPRGVDFTLEEEEEEEEVGANVVPAPPPSTGRMDIVVDKASIRELDLSPAHAVLRKFVHRIGDNITEPSTHPQELFDRTVGFVLKYERDNPLDPRELSEMPDIRLWFVRLDATYPWLPIVLDWKAGELARYAAMLVPHQMSKKQGLVFNPEALEVFAMSKVFAIYPWLRARGVKSPHSKLTSMLRMIGLGVSREFYALMNRHPPPP